MTQQSPKIDQPELSRQVSALLGRGVKMWKQGPVYYVALITENANTPYVGYGDHPEAAVADFLKQNKIAPPTPPIRPSRAGPQPPSDYMK